MTDIRDRERLARLEGRADGLKLALAVGIAGLGAGVVALGAALAACCGCRDRSNPPPDTGDLEAILKAQGYTVLKLRGLEDPPGTYHLTADKGGTHITATVQSS